MKWSSTVSPDAWKGLALEAAWKIRPDNKPRKLSPTWPVLPQELERVRLLWPSHYEWQPCYKWVEPLLEGLRQHVRVERDALRQQYPGIVTFQLILDNKHHDIAIDYSDDSQCNLSCANECAVYFKMQFSGGGYPFENILPGGFVPNGDEIYTHLPYVRALADSRRPKYDVYGRFGLEFAGDIRRKACSLLAAEKSLHWNGGLKTRRYSLALREIASSKVCIDFPGTAISVFA